MANRRPTQRRPIITERVQIAQIEANERVQKHAQNAKAWCRFWDFMKFPIIIGGLGYFGYMSIKCLAGQTTGAEIIIKFIADVKFAASLAVAGSGVYYGHKQKKLRENHIKSTSKYIEKLELLLNPARGSSNISVTGNTREEDR